MNNRKPTVVIVGAGLGGCVVGNALTDRFDVTMVELGVDVGDLQARLDERGVPAKLHPHIGSGLGGTTALWHNALIEVSEGVFEDCWPFSKSELAPWYREAFELLGGVSRAEVESGGEALRAKHRAVALVAPEMPVQFLPQQRRNLWHSLRLEGRVNLVRGEVERLVVDENSRVAEVVVREEFETRRIAADLFILAAGGLGTPVLLQALDLETTLPALRHAGCYYEDHPMAFVGLLESPVPLYRFWNYPLRNAAANIRMPLVVLQDGLRVSFQLRPAALLMREGRREKMATVITKLRNNPFNPAAYFELLRHPDDLLDILSFRFGIRLPTRHYSLLMVAEQPRSDERDIDFAIDPESGQRRIRRNWRLPDSYLEVLRRAVAQFILSLGPLVVSFRAFDDWERTLDTAAHHSGTARMSATPDTGVCDANAKVHGMHNLYVADGSLIPASGIANTGLTIAALSLRLAAHLNSIAR